MAGLLWADLSEADFLTLAGCYSESTASRGGGWGVVERCRKQPRKTEAACYGSEGRRR